MNHALHKERVIFGIFAILFIGMAALSAYSGSYGLIAIPFGILLFYAAWQNRNLVFGVLLFSLPLSFEYHFSSGLGTDIPDESLMWLSSFLFFAAWLYAPEIIPARMLRHPLLVLFFLSLVWTIPAALFSTNTTVSLKFILAKCWYAGAFILAPLMVLKDKRRMGAAAFALLCAMLIVVIIALWRHATNGFQFARVNESIFPFFRNHVNYSAMLVCMIPLAVAFFYLTNNKSGRILWAGITVLFLVALFFSYARGAWLALLIGALSWWLIRRKWLFRSYLFVVILTIGALFWVKSGDRYLQYAPDFRTTIFHKNFAEHLVATYQLKDVSTAERFYRWIAGVRMIKDNWLTGYGPNTFYENYMGYAVPAYKTWVSDNKDHSTVHNYFLLTAIEQGLPGLLLLLVLFGALLFYAQRLYHRVKDTFYRAVAGITGVVISMILVVNFLSDLIETDKIGSLFFLCLSVLIVADHHSATSKPIEESNTPDSELRTPDS